MLKRFLIAVAGYSAWKWWKGRDPHAHRDDRRVDPAE